jgi:predicted AAA+ superfamily ATPase
LRRKIIDELIRWKTEDEGRQILLTGAKGVGKTYLAYDFAKAFFGGIYYMNLEREPKALTLFQERQTDQLISAFVDYHKINMEDSIENRILILDEISYCTEVVELLKRKELSSVFRFILCISSRPISPEASSGLKELRVNPLEFDEFLLATSNEWYIESIQTHFQLNRKIPEIVHKELLAFHQLYLQIGGMPAMVNEYLNLMAAVNVSEQQNFLIGSYHDSIIRDNPDSEALKMNQVYDSIPFQLLKENKKFQYKLIRKGTTHAMYKDAIRRLMEEHFILNCNRISSEQLAEPIKTFQSADWRNVELNTTFKLYLSDTGLLHTKIAEVMEDNLSVYSQKALLENYVAQTLQAKSYPFAFWESDSMAKVDFIFLKNQTLLPIEIFENENTRSKSISILKQKCEFPYSIKVSSKNFDFSNGVKYVPYYAVFCL